MNILFLSLADYDSLDYRGLYSDLLRQFVKHGHTVFLISPFEKRKKQEERVIKEPNAVIVKIPIYNMQKTNILTKGLSMITIDGRFIKAIKKYYADVKFDLILYPTPPISLLRSIEYIKKRDNCKTYLMLKDIFPQNAVDIGLMTTEGVKGVIYRYFRKKEKKLYSLSDHIGCMSQANVDYVISHNPEVDKGIVSVCPNSIEVLDRSINDDIKIRIRNKYGIPQNKFVFIYGGNLGKPQGIKYMIQCLKTQALNEEVFFLIVGSGTEYEQVNNFVATSKINNVKVIRQLPKDDYELLVSSSDVGLIFLDHRFTIPNFPSRLLGYMQSKLPVFAVTDVHTDIGKVVVEGGFGWWCESNDVELFAQYISLIVKEDLSNKKENAWAYIRKYYDVRVVYEKMQIDLQNDNYFR